MKLLEHFGGWRPDLIPALLLLLAGCAPAVPPSFGCQSKMVDGDLYTKCVPLPPEREVQEK